MAASNFELACEEIKAFIEKVKDEDKLVIYGFFKQATIGDCNTSKPGIFDQKGRYKWDYWNKNKGMSTEKAKEEYVNLIKKLATGLGLKDVADRL